MGYTCGTDTLQFLVCGVVYYQKSMTSKLVIYFGHYEQNCCISVLKRLFSLPVKELTFATFSDRHFSFLYVCPKITPLQRIEYYLMLCYRRP